MAQQQRSVEGWIIMLLASPLIQWGSIQVSVSIFSAITRTQMQFGKPIPSFIEFLFIWLFAVPTAAGAYLEATQPDRRRRLYAWLAIIIPPVGLFAIQLVDRIIQSLAAQAWLMDGWLLLALLIGLIAYVLLTIGLARMIVKWQSLHG